MLAQQLVNGAMLGLVYALLALGFSLMYSTTRVVNFAHGEMFTLGAFIGLWAQRSLGMPYLASAALAVALVSLFSYLLSYLVLQALSSPLQRSVATIAVSLALRDAMLLLFGSDTASYAPVFPPGSFVLGTVSIPRAQVIVSAVTSVLLVLFGLIALRTRFGIRMRAAAQDGALAATCGIPIRHVGSSAFAIGAGLAATAGVLIGPTWQVSYSAGGPIAVKAFTAALIGGVGSLWGAMVGGVLLGAIEALFSSYVSSTWKDVTVFSCMILVLVLLPRGILAARKRRVA